MSQILYIGARLPVRSETFVYREVLALRERGHEVWTASVHAPERGLGDEALEQLAVQSVPIYGSGWRRLLQDALLTWLRHPVAATRVVALAVRDAILGRQTPVARRPKLLVQCVAGLALDRRLRQVTIERVHAHMAHVPTSIAMYFAALRGIPFSFTGHAADLFRDHALLPDKLRRATFVACISHWHQAFYRRLVPALQLQQLPVVRCGVEVPSVPVAIRRRVERPRILAVGRLVEKKGFDILIRALAELQQRGVMCDCLLLGDGPQEQSLRQLAADVNLAERLMFLGARSNQEVQAKMRQCDLFVLPCRPAASGDRDGIPVVLMEAMAAGVPVVSGDLETIRELVLHQQTGWMVEPGNVASLADALERLLGDAELREQLGAAGRAHVMSEFSLAKNIDRLALAMGLSRTSDTRELNHTRPCYQKAT